MKELEATEIALEKITDLLISHKYKPGDRLLETILANELQLSRTPIRDALSRLVASGFLEKPKGQKGYQIPLLTPEDMKHVFQTRMLLEGHAVRKATEVCTHEDIIKLRELNQKEITAFHSNEKEVYANINHMFHLFIANIPGNDYISRFVEQTFWRSRLYNFFFAGFYNLDDKLIQFRMEHQKFSYQEHLELINAMEEQRVDYAGDLMEEHIKKTYFHLLNPQAQR